MTAPIDRGPLAVLVAKRPRLMATPALTTRMRVVLQDGRITEWRKKVVEQADLILTLPSLSPTWIPDPTEVASAPLSRPPLRDPGGGAPATPLDIARIFVLRIQTLGIVWFATGDARYRDRAVNELLVVCAFPHWRGDEFLVTAETMFGAAIGYDWFFDALSDRERQAAASAILTKGVQPGRDEFAADTSPPHWTWPRQQTNWNLVCNSALMIAALSVAETDWAAAGQIFDLCRRSISFGFDQYGPDGGWAEGPGYWHYATQYAVYLVDSLKTALGEISSSAVRPGLAIPAYSDSTRPVPRASCSISATVKRNTAAAIGCSGSPSGTTIRSTLGSSDSTTRCIRWICCGSIRMPVRYQRTI